MRSTSEAAAIPEQKHAANSRYGQTGAAGRLRAFFTAVAGLFIFSTFTYAQDTVRHDLQIESQPIGGALKALAAQTGLQVLVFSQDAGNNRSPAVFGSFTNEEALLQILDDSGLTFRKIDDNTVAIRKKGAMEESETALHSTRYDGDRNALRFAQAEPSSSAAGASSSDSSSDSSSNEPAKLEQIVVTAQRRSQALIDVPMTVTALGSAQLESAGVTTTTDLPLLTPNLQVVNSSGTDLFFLRGIGTSNATTTSESSIAFYLDDVYYPDAASALTSLKNVQRVEVLSGPQGTLYGRNATGGLIRVVTPDPQQEPLVKASVGYESYNTITGSIYATGGPSDQLAASVEADLHHQGNGFGTNLALNEDINFVKTQSFTGKVLWKPDEADRITVVGRYYKNTSDFDQYYGAFPGTVTVTGQGYSGSPYDLYANLKMYPQTTTTDGSVVWQHKFDNGLTFKSVSAYHDASWSAPDADLTSSAPAWADASETLGLISYQQELLLQGTTNLFAQTLDFTTGLFYFRSTRDFALLLTLLPPIGPVEQDEYARITTRSYAGFGQVDYQLTERDTLTAGARYTYDKLGDNGIEIINSSIEAASIHQSVHSDKVSWRVAFEHKFTADWMVYTSASTGYKSGTFNSQVLTPDTEFVKPETLYAYEVGSKVEFLNRSVQLNVDAFYYNYKNLQVEEVVNNALFLQNAATAKPYGAELQSLFALPVPVGDLQLRGNLSYLHARYSSFPGCNVNSPNPYPPGGNTASTGDCSGHQLIYSPNFSGTVSANYKVPVKQLGGTLGAVVTFYHGSPFYSEPSAVVRLPSHDLLSAELAYSFLDDRARVRAYGTNLTNRHYFFDITDSLETAGFPSAPRILGIEFEYTWR